MPLDANTQLLWMLGHPVAQTLSPGIFNRAFEALLQPIAMVAIDVPPAQLGVTLSVLRHSSNVHGALLTVPHKLPACQHVPQLSERSRALGLVNVIKRDPSTGQLMGDALDGQGFCAALHQRGYQLQGWRVLIIGCGGAGGASAWDALQAGAAQVGLLDLNTVRSDALYQVLSARFGSRKVQQVHSASGAWNCVLNASPSGMYDNAGLPCAIDQLSETVVLVDAVTRSDITPWLRSAELQGLNTIDGYAFAAAQAADIARFFQLPEGIVNFLQRV
jgi:shikimate dehydrogenase